jgi:hypothetical protein
VATKIHGTQVMRIERSQKRSSRKDIIISVSGYKDSCTSTVPSRKDIILLVC